MDHGEKIVIKLISINFFSDSKKSYMFPNYGGSAATANHHAAAASSMWAASGRSLPQAPQYTDYNM
jgi:hypothetical protein